MHWWQVETCLQTQILILENKLIFFQTLWQKREFPPVGIINIKY